MPQLRIVVLVKQVPDTANVTGEAMKEDGTINRSALPAVFNPEDLNALEEALELRDRHDARVTVLTMGPPAAVQVLRESLYRGADEVILLTDKAFAGADTLATSYALALAVEKLGGADLVLCGRQAIDGDTAQVGPQTAEKLGYPQITCVSRIDELRAPGGEAGSGAVTATRSIEGGFETLTSSLPCLLTVTGEANDPRPPSVKLVMTYKGIAAEAMPEYDDSYLDPESDELATLVQALTLARENGASLGVLTVIEHPPLDELPLGTRTMIGLLDRDQVRDMVEQRQRLRLQNQLSSLALADLDVRIGVESSATPFLTIIQSVLRQGHDLLIAVALNPDGCSGVAGRSKPAQNLETLPDTRKIQQPIFRQTDEKIADAVAGQHDERREAGERQQRDAGTAQGHAPARDVRSSRARVTSPGAAQRRGGHDDAVDLDGDRLRVLLGQRLRRAGAQSHATRGGRAREDQHQVRAEVLQLLAHALLRAAADREHRDHRRDADDHAEHRQRRSQLVDAQRLQRDAQDHQRVHACTFMQAPRHRDPARAAPRRRTRAPGARPTRRGRPGMSRAARRTRRRRARA